MSGKPTINPWTRPDHVVDIHIDCEFVDQGNAGTHFISIGAVVVGNQGRVNFYGINRDFFKSKVFFDTFHPKTDAEKEQQAWMLSHVYAHITGTAVAGKEHRKGTVDKLVDLLEHPSAVFNVDFDQTFLLRNNKGEWENGNEPDVTVVGKLNAIAKGLTESIDSVRAEDKGEDNVTRIWCYYAASDHVCLQQIYGCMLAMPETFNYYDYDIRAIGDLFGYQHSELNCNGPHHALSDAVEQYTMAQKLRKMIAKDYGDKFVPNPNQEW